MRIMLLPPSSQPATLPMESRGMNSIAQRLLAILFVLGSAWLASAQSDLKCFVCQEPLTGRYHMFDSPALAEKKPICDACVQLETVCFICNLPVKTNYQTLEDGRLLCEQDAKVAVFSPNEAASIWEGARREVAGMFAGFGPLPQNFSVSLVDRTQLAKIYTNQSSWHDKSMTLGLTHTHIKNGNQFEHAIYLLNGVSPARLAAVSAHEYGHAWLHENVSRERRLDGDTVEGFCELVAYKLMTQRNESIEKKVLLANTYTRGQINTLIQAEENFQFFRVLDWFKTGEDGRIDKSEMVRLLKLQKERPPSALWYPPAPPTLVPNTLTLKGISGTSKRRFALINDCTLAKNEEGKVRVGKTNVFVRCLEILEHSVVIQARGSPGKIELSLRSDE